MENRSSSRRRAAKDEEYMKIIQKELDRVTEAAENYFGHQNNHKESR